MSQTAPTIPVLIVTGFLGSGKTTLLNALLGQREMEGTLAIINEFGEIGLDHLLLEVTEEKLALLDNGCVCCTVRDDLIQTLIDLDARQAKGEMQPVRRVILETTGLADPAPILHALMMQPELEGRYHIDAVVTLVDAVNGAATLANHVEARKQVAVADRIVLSKGDLADRATLTEVGRAIGAINPGAKLHVCENGRIGARDLVETGFFARPRNPEDFAAWAAQVDGAVEAGCCGHGHDHDHHHHIHGNRHEGIVSYAFVIDEPVERAAFQTWLGYLAALKGNDLLRMKGLVRIAEDPDRPLVVHGVQHIFHQPRHLDRWPSDDRRTRLVFIVKDIPRETIERTLVKFAAISPGRVRGVVMAEQPAID